MAKRRVKKRTHVGAANGKTANGHSAPTKAGQRVPKSMVIRIGASEVGPSVSQLVHDVRGVLEPHTASRLKERRNNKLRDYTTMAGPLGVSHLLLFSRSEGKGNVQMRLCVTPRGPTLHFRVEKYSLCKDLQKSQRRPRQGGKEEFMAAPLLVMNNFSSKQEESQEENGAAGSEKQRIPKHLEQLTTTIFQSLFPPINPVATPLNGIKRILLLDRTPPVQSSTSERGEEVETNPQYILNLRHYAIETRTAKSVPKSLRKLDRAEKLSHTHAGQKRKRSGLPNLGKLEDVADYLLDPHAADGFTSGSESEPETDAEVEVLTETAQKISERKRRQQEQRQQQQQQEENGVGGERIHAHRDPARKANVERKAIKLHELGPRMRLRLTKVEEGLCGGKVMWHEYIHKSKAEQVTMDRKHESRRLEKEKRRAEQKANVERKKADRRAKGEPEDQEGDEEEEFLSDAEDDEWDDEDEADEEMLDGESADENERG